MRLSPAQGQDFAARQDGAPEFPIPILAASRSRLVLWFLLLRNCQDRFTKICLCRLSHQSNLHRVDYAESPISARNRDGFLSYPRYCADLESTNVLPVRVIATKQFRRSSSSAGAAAFG
jgi:hypothetical protein